MFLQYLIPMKASYEGAAGPRRGTGVCIARSGWPEMVMGTESKYWVGVPSIPPSGG